MNNVPRNKKKDRFPRRDQTFWYFLLVGVVAIYLSGLELIEHREPENLVRLSGIVVGSRIIHVPKNTDGRKSEYFDLFVYLKGSNSPYIFRSFQLAEPQRLSNALQVGQFAELDVSKKRNRIWGVTSDGVMVLSPVFTAGKEMERIYWILAFGVACIIVSVVARAWPKSRNPHEHFR